MSSYEKNEEKKNRKYNSTSTYYIYGALDKFTNSHRRGEATN